MAIRDLWRKLTQRRAKDKESDVRHDKIPPLDHFVQPPKATGMEKPKY